MLIAHFASNFLYNKKFFVITITVILIVCIPFGVLAIDHLSSLPTQQSGEYNHIISDRVEFSVDNTNFTFEKSSEESEFYTISFIFSANKGQELKSLSKTASGGELSRFMLAVKNIFSQIYLQTNKFMLK